MADAEAWGRLSAQEQADSRSALEQNGDHLKSLLWFAQVRRRALCRI
jgi:hypothetical protein